MADFGFPFSSQKLETHSLKFCPLNPSSVRLRALIFRIGTPKNSPNCLRLSLFPHPVGPVNMQCDGLLAGIPSLSSNNLLHKKRCAKKLSASRAVSCPAIKFIICALMACAGIASLPTRESLPSITLESIGGFAVTRFRVSLLSAGLSLVAGV